MFNYFNNSYLQILFLIHKLPILTGSKSVYSSTKTPTDPTTTLNTTTTTEEITTITKFNTENSSTSTPTTTTDNIPTTTKDDSISAICKNTEFDAVVFDNGYIKASKDKSTIV